VRPAPLRRAGGRLAPVGSETMVYTLTWLDTRGAVRDVVVVGLEPLRARALLLRSEGGTMLRAVDEAGRLALTYYYGD